MSSAPKSEVRSERPILQFSVLCDAVATPQEIGNKPVFIGVFSQIQRPSGVPQFFVANRWINGLGEHTQRVRILGPDLSEIARSADFKFVLPTRTHSQDVFNGFVNLSFSKAGVYWVAVDLDDKLAVSYPLPVFEEPVRSASDKASRVEPQAAENQTHSKGRA